MQRNGYNFYIQPILLQLLACLLWPVGIQTKCFVVTYTNVLQTISSVFLFTTITRLPSKQFHIVWYLDPNIKVFGCKFLLLTIVCLILLSLLLILNALLLFTKTLMRFSVIHRLKQFTDALQGLFKNQYYYWGGVHLLIRNSMLLISVLEKNLSISVECIIMMTAAILHSYLQPYKNKLINFQEMILLYNYVILCVLLLFDGGEFSNVIISNVMVGLSFLQFTFIIVYHIYSFIFVLDCIILHKSHGENSKHLAVRIYTMMKLLNCKFQRLHVTFLNFKNLY